VSVVTKMPTRQGYSSALSGVGSFQVSLGTGSAGDVMVLVVEQTSGSAPSASGWTLRATQVHGSRTGYYLTKVREANETTVLVTRATDSTARFLVFGVAGAKPDPSTWVFGVPRYRGTSPVDSPNTVTTANGITTTAPNTLVLGIFGEATAAAEANPSTYVPTVANGTAYAFAGQQSSGDIESILVAYKEMPTAGATGAMTATYLNGHNSNSWGVLIGLPSVETSNEIARLSAVMSDGRGNPVEVGLVGWDGTKEVELSKIEMLHSGTFVPDLERTQRVFLMGHRGGSLDYQEHSARGYVQSSIAHMDIMEFSIGCTSDGVFFGLHDREVNRTSSSLGPSAAQGGVDYLPSQHTWAEISALVQDLPSRGDSRFSTQPYMRIEDFVNQWLPSHTLMFDPKYLSAAQRVNLYAYLASLPDHQRRIMGKFYHTGTQVADDFHAIGCKAWGYAYSEAITGLKSNGTPTTEPLLSATAEKWDMLGQEHSATQAVWTETLRIAGGKKVIGHIVGTAAQAQAAVAKGAHGLQVSGVNAVSAVY